MLTTRGLIHRALDSARIHRLGKPLLAFPPTRVAYTALYERVGHTKFGDAMARAVNEDAVSAPFVWHSRVLEKELLMPVDPRDARGTWHAAFNWSWSGHRHMRRFYERWLREHSPPGIFFDLGANYGTHSFPLALYGWRCIAFEPQPICTEFIQHVNGWNGFVHPVRIEQALVSDVEGELPFSFSDTTWTSSVLSEHTDRYEPGRSHPSVIVPATSVDAFVSRSRLAPQLIKIDVEGWELHVLRGAISTIQQYRPTLLIEVVSGAPHASEVWQLLRDNDYTAFIMAPQRDVLVCDHAMFTGNKWDNFFAVPN